MISWSLGVQILGFGAFQLLKDVTIYTEITENTEYLDHEQKKSEDMKKDNVPKQVIENQFLQHPYSKMDAIQ